MGGPLRNSLVAVVAYVLLMPALAGAQVTTVVRPPRQAIDTSAASIAATADTGRVRDSVIAMRLADMQAWVDSAAVAMSDSAPPDTTQLAGEIAPSEAPPLPSPARRPRGARGVPAPETASILPFLLAASILMLGAGWWLRRMAARAQPVLARNEAAATPPRREST